MVEANGGLRPPRTGGVQSDPADDARNAGAMRPSGWRGLRRTWSLLISVCLIAGLVLAWSSPAHAADRKAFCATNVKLSLAFFQLFAAANGQPTPAQLQQGQAPILALIDQAVATAPADIVDQVKAIADAAHANFQAALNDPAVTAASTKIDAYAVKNCGYPVINVTATEYKFKGVPKTLKAGTLLVNFKDAGSESHEITIARIKTSDSVKTLVALPKGQATTRVELLGNTMSDPGQSSVGYFQLTKPGRYVVICLIPQGTTTNNPGNGPPHAKLGMYAEFTVTK